MGEIFDLAERRADKDGRITPKAVVDSILEFMEKHPGSTEKIAIVARMEDGMINTAYSTMNHLETIGLYETAKALVIEEMGE